MHLHKILLYVIAIACTLLKVAGETKVENSPPVKISLKTPWESTPLILEAIEFLTKDHKDSDIYFNLLSKVFQNELPTTTYSLYQYILNLPEVTEMKKEVLLKLSLSLHSEAPLIQAHYHYYNASVVPSHQNSNEKFDKNCENWMDWYGIQVCSIEKLMDVAKISLTNGKYTMEESEKESPLNLPIDHIKKSISKENGVVIFYCDVMSQGFSKMLNKLLQINKEAGLTIIVRYKKSKNSNENITISGYGVEMAIKNTEYKVIDDRKLKTEGNEDNTQNTQKIIPNIPIKEFDVEALKKEYPEKSEEFDNYYNYLKEQKIPVLKKLPKNETENIGTKLIQYIKSSTSPLYVFEQLINNFPRVQHIINQMPLIEDFNTEVLKIQKIVAYSTTDIDHLFINGIDIDIDELNPFNVLRLMELETKSIMKLKSLGFTNKESVNFLNSGDDNYQKKDESECYDVRDEIVTWWNDLETDSRYKNWPSDLKEILRPLYYRGQLHQVSKNLYSSLLCMDITKIENLEILKNVFIFIERLVPIRFGIVPTVDKESKSSINSLTSVIYEVLFKNFSIKTARGYIENLTNLISNGKKINESELRKIVNSVISRQKPKDIPKGVSLTNYEEIVDFGMEKYFNMLVAFNERFAITQSNPAIFVNGLYSELNNEWQQFLIGSAVSELETIQEKYYYKEISNSDNIYNKILERPNVRKRKNIYVYPSEENPEKYIDILSLESLDKLKYLTNSGKLGSHVSLWTISDLSTKKGVKLALEGLKFLNTKEGKNTRLAIIHSPNDESNNVNVLSNIINQVSMVSIPKENEDLNPIDYLIQLLEERMKMDDDVTEKAILKKAFEINDNFEKLMIQSNVDYINQEPVVNFKPISQLALNNKKNIQAIVINGRLIGPWNEDVIFSQDDIKLAVEYEFNHHIRHLIGMVRLYGKKKEWDAPIKKWYSDTIMKVSYVVSSEETADEIKNAYEASSKSRLGNEYFKKFNSKKTYFSVGDIETAKFQFSAVINPLSENGQKLASFLIAIQKMPEIFIEIQFIVPKKSEEELELNRFFRYVFKTEMEFNENKELILPTAEFQNIPIDPLFTVGIHVPQAWLVTPIISVYDLDNICLKSVESDGVNAIFELKNILLEGHARDIRLNTPPRGVQLILGTKSFPSIVDTIVMANLGYFQLKANPGVWELKLRPGRSSELYDIINIGKNYRSWFNEPDEAMKELYEINGVTVALTSFEGATIFLRTDKKIGMEKEDVLSEKTEETDEKIWGKIKKTFGMSKEKKDTEKINIFSVASGHLYERLLSVMTLGVMKHTKTPVKFWLIENFLSPSFKNFIPHLAKEYGFEYELVTYKWPHWLRSQSEKQRTIWGYKILFLDVLFPLSLEKVIFVDADQIVRADLKELVEMDLHGAPYGYTPFCNSRKETEGFRFWKTGYWEKHLHGKPYHISALYVIDLVKFRQMAAGDRLRGEYQLLSSDKNSLANLDQDLPNNMQDAIPIFSLPQEWLWCETWCDDESLKTAKTIDLCNNPLTKEPKLDRARRLLPEWSVYDNEVAEFEKKVEKLMTQNIETKNKINEKDEL